MGIPFLNRFLKEKCSRTGIYKIQFNQLRDKVIVVDANNFVYRFLSENALLENFYFMISIFRYYNIKPLFVFDGKIPLEKMEMLQLRKEIKDNARRQYQELKDKLDNLDVHTDDYTEMVHTMNALKKRFTTLKKNDIKLVKMLMKAYGVTYIEAEEEADILCAKIVAKKMAYACMSEDMDLFVYGCPRVLRYTSLLNQSAILYDHKIILNELKLNKQEFKEICVLSGTDYNYGMTKHTSIFRTFKLFHKWQRYTKQLQVDEKQLDFYNWLNKETNYISDIYKLYNTLCMFNMGNCAIQSEDAKQMKNIKNKIVQQDLLHLIMEKENFVFI